MSWEKFKKVVENHGEILGYIKDLPHGDSISKIKDKSVDWSKDK